MRVEENRAKTQPLPDVKANFMVISRDIRDLREVAIRHDIRQVAHLLGYTFPLTKGESVFVARLVRARMRQRELLEEQRSTMKRHN